MFAHTLASFPGPTRLFIIYSVWSCSVKMLSACCSAPHVAAAPGMKALKALHAHPLIQVGKSHIVLVADKLKQPVRNQNSGKPHARNLLQHS